MATTMSDLDPNVPTLDCCEGEGYNKSDLAERVGAMLEEAGIDPMYARLEHPEEKCIKKLQDEMFSGLLKLHRSHANLWKRFEKLQAEHDALKISYQRAILGTMSNNDLIRALIMAGSTGLPRQEELAVQGSDAAAALPQEEEEASYAAAIDQEDNNATASKRLKSSS